MSKYVIIIFLILTTAQILATDFPVATISQFNDALTDSGVDDTDGLRASGGDTITWANNSIPYHTHQLNFEASGAPGSPIIVRAETPGGVIFDQQSWLIIKGSYLQVEGIEWTPGQVDGTLTQDAIVVFDSTSDQCRLTQCRIRNGRGGGMSYVEVGGTNNRVDHCNFTLKDSRRPMLSVTLSGMAADASINHLIDWNEFSNFRRTSDLNDFETIRIGDSSNAQISAKITVENNYFYRCDGENELISNKSSDSIFRKNTIVECKGGMSLRHGDGNLVEGNYFFGHYIPETLGVRVINEDQTVVNNYFESLDSTDQWDAAITIFSGILNSPANGYHQVKNTLLAHNTFINNRECIRLSNLHGSTSTFIPTGSLINQTYTHSELPINTILSNNLFYFNRGPILTEVALAINTTIEGNLVHGDSPQGVPISGVVLGDPLLVSNGYYYGIGDAVNSAAIDTGSTGTYPPLSLDLEQQPRDIMPDIGSDEISNIAASTTLLQVHQVGSDWVKDIRFERGIVQFSSSDVIVVSEPTSGTTTIEIPITRTFGTTGDTIVRYQLVPSDGAPLVGLDYPFIEGATNMPANSSASRNITIPIMADLVPDGTKSLVVMFKANSPTATWISNESGVGLVSARKVIIEDSPIDAWTHQYFGDSFVLPPADLFEDPDGDNIPNVLEFELLGNPLKQDQQILPEINDGVAGPEVTFTRNTEAKGVEWTIEASDTPSNDDNDWSVAATRSADGVWTTAPDVACDENTETGEVVITGWETHSRKFIRFRNAFPWREPRYKSSTFNESYQWIEAETALPSANFAPWEKIFDTTASWDLAISPSDSSTAEVPSDGVLSYDFNLSSPKTVAIWVRLKAPSGAGNSVYVKTSDQATWDQWNISLLTTSWDWRQWEVPVSFTAGAHSIDVAYRESAFEMDRLLVTDDLSLVPTGIGTTPSP